MDDKERRRQVSSMRNIKLNDISLVRVSQDSIFHLKDYARKLKAAIRAWTACIKKLQLSLKRMGEC